WHFSHVHNAILGPFGELMTEADLNRIEKQIENLQVMHKMSEVEKDLEELERELHQLLPVSAALNQEYFSVNPKQVHGQAEDLPAWCSKISTLLKSMAILLATLGGKEIDILDFILSGNSQEEAKNITAGQSREDVEREIKQCGVSVKNLKANYELQTQTQSTNDPSDRVYKRKMSLPVLYVSSEAMAPTKEFNQALSSDPVLTDNHLKRSLEVQTDLSYVQECIEMRKERIVLLFLEHWRKYTISESYWTKHTGRRGNYLDVGCEDYSQFNAQMGDEVHSEDDKMIMFMKSKQVVGNLIGHWRSIMSQVPSRQIRRLSRAQMIYWPEHFLPHFNGSPVSYESLTLDLFMLGYFQLLEMNMSRRERKFRHLMCYEMFDRLGSHKWEVIRQFHKEVMVEIESGKRDWADGFEDIKVKHFGDVADGAEVEAKQTSMDNAGSEPKKDLPPMKVRFAEEPRVDQASPRDETSEDAIKVIYELKEFSNEEIIRYIDRSFAFWKEKEAELFDI
uniref:Espin like b n=1 Tax=Poecilia formosa TaxID=48698 RepID=A0A096M362_POEFO